STLLLAGSALALAGCDSGQEEVRIFSDAQACVADGVDAERCQQAFQDAEAEHLATAPRFPTLGECEQEVGEGACREVRQEVAGGGGSSFFMPFMVGYLVSEVIDEVGDAYKRKRYARPLYADRRGYVYSGGNSVTRFGGGCNPAARNCGSSGVGSGALVGASTGRWSARTTVAADAVQSRPTAAAPTASRSSGRSFGGFGGTGSRASSGGG
ncbi:MAG TPA: DUF1190 domain-containing protein, partial [Azospirillaceae bacterium]|nr:DUF1190 domain-containing protein [Azospirillaceae bacterium]